MKDTRGRGSPTWMDFGPKFLKQVFIYWHTLLREESEESVKIAKNKYFYAKIHHKGCEGKFGQLEEGSFLKPGGRPP